MSIKICTFCGQANDRKRSNFCSENCRQRSKYKPKTSPICLVCGKPSLKLSDYCSSTCYSKHRYEPVQIENKCIFCETIFIKNIKSRFCSSKCRNAFNYWDKNKRGLCCCGKELLPNLSCCKGCHKKRKTYKSDLPRPLEQQLFNSAKARAKKKKLPINITIEDIIVPDKCPVLGLKLERGIGKALPNSPSIDRIIPELGYIKGNIMIISHKANTIKNNSTIKEVELVLNYMKNYSA